MSRFVDSANREWIVEISAWSAKQLRDALSVDLLSTHGRGLESLFSDLITCVDSLYLLCRDQAQERGVSDEDFGRMLAGESLEAAINALQEAVVNFIPPRAAKLLMLAITRTEEIQAKRFEAAEKMVQSDEMEKIISNGQAAGR